MKNLLAFAFISMMVLASCATNEHSQEKVNVPIDSTGEEIDTTASSEYVQEAEQEYVFCCGNHVKSPHCGTSNQLASLTRRYGCKDFE